MALETLDPKVLDHFKRLGKKRAYARGSTIFRRGEVGVTMLFIEKGRAEVSITTSFGQKSILAMAGVGDVLGDIACLDGGARSADVVAVEAMVVLEIQRRDVVRVLREDGDMAFLVIEALCHKARNASEMFEVKTLSSGRSRLASCLLRLLGDEDADVAGRVRVSQSWLGSYAGLTRENVNRQLRSWAAEGIARFENGEVVIEDYDALVEVALSDDNLP